MSLGLITTELVLNALKHAFRDRNTGQVIVTYEATDPQWCLSVTDDGIGRSHGTDGLERVGLGTGIVEVLARQLGGHVQTASSSQGTKVSITHTI